MKDLRNKATLDLFNDIKFDLLDSVKDKLKDSGSCVLHWGDIFQLLGNNIDFFFSYDISLKINGRISIPEFSDARELHYLRSLKKWHDFNIKGNSCACNLLIHDYEKLSSDYDIAIHIKNNINFRLLIDIIIEYLAKHRISHCDIMLLSFRKKKFLFF